MFTFLQQTLGVPAEFTLMLGGLGLILSAILNPEGIAGGLRRDGLRLVARLRARKPSEAPPSVHAASEGAA